MKPYEHQVELAKVAAEVIKKHMIVYLASEERTGKTLASILVAEQLNVKRVAVVTKKKALSGWHETLEAFPHTKLYVVTNYHQAHKLQGKFDLIILDESHNYISGVPKAGKIQKELRKITKGVPLIYISATPYPQGPQMLYHQFQLSSWSPWIHHGNFYRWFDLYGKPYTLPINGIKVPQYDRVDSKLILATCEDFFVTRTRAEVGMEHEPEDVLHYIKLDDATKWVYNELTEHDLVELSVGMLVCDTTSKLRTSLHQLEGGTIKLGDKERYVLANTEKVDYILEHFGDSEDVVIMYNYIAEREKLEKYFKRATILQATSYAEGVDLHKFEHLIIYSQDFSTARHTQRRARQCNQKRDTPIKVHFLLVKGALSAHVYKTVSINKKNFVDSVFNKEYL